MIDKFLFTLAVSDTVWGKLGFVGWVTILNSAAIASYSYQGGRVVSISTIVQPKLLQNDNFTEKYNHK